MDSVWSDGSLNARTGALHSDNRSFPVLLNHSDMHTCNLDLTLFIEVFIIGQLPFGMEKRLNPLIGAECILHLAIY